MHRRSTCEDSSFIASNSLVQLLRCCESNSAVSLQNAAEQCHPPLIASGNRHQLKVSIPWRHHQQGSLKRYCWSVDAPLWNSIASLLSLDCLLIHPSGHHRQVDAFQVCHLDDLMLAGDAPHLLLPSDTDAFSSPEQESSLMHMSALCQVTHTLSADIGPRKSLMS